MLRVEEGGDLDELVYAPSAPLRNDLIRSVIAAGSTCAGRRTLSISERFVDLSFRVYQHHRNGETHLTSTHTPPIGPSDLAAG